MAFAEGRPKWVSLAVGLALAVALVASYAPGVWVGAASDPAHDHMISIEKTVDFDTDPDFNDVETGSSGGTAMWKIVVTNTSMDVGWPTAINDIEVTDSNGMSWPKFNLAEDGNSMEFTYPEPEITVNKTNTATVVGTIPIPHGGSLTVGPVSDHAAVNVICVECGACEGQVTSLTLLNNGDGGFIRVEGKKKTGVVFEGNVANGATFSFNGTGKDGKLGSEIKISVDGVETAKIHTSCSRPIGTGMIFGPFEVIAGESLKGGPLCPAASGGGGCTTKVQAMLLRYTGPTILGATVEFESDKGQTVVYSPVDLISGVTELSDPGQNGFTIDATVGGEIEFGAKTSIRINGVEEVIHTSCSTPFVAQAPAPLDQPKGAPSPNWFVVSFTQK